MAKHWPWYKDLDICKNMNITVQHHMTMDVYQVQKRYATDEIIAISINPDFMERLSPRDLEEMLEQKRKASPLYIHPGPTNEELRNPAIRNAWNEWQLVYRLASKGIRI